MPQDLEKKRACNRAYYQTHKEESAKRHKAYYDIHKEEIAESGKVYYQTHKHIRREQTWLSSQKVKLEVFIHYSSNPPKCLSCEEDDIRILTIDHIDNNGAEHRSRTGLSSGTSFYYWLRREDYPKGFQVLCANCNMRKEIEYRRRKALNA